MEKDAKNTPDAIEDLVTKTAIGLVRKASEDNLDPQIAQASFGCAWLWLVQMAQNTPEEFQAMTDSLNKYYAECWEKDAPIRERWEKHHASGK